MGTPGIDHDVLDTRGISSADAATDNKEPRGRHNLRSALDGLVWQLALRSVAIPFDRSAFPIFLKGRSSQRRRTFWDSQSGGGLNLLKSVDPRHRKQIESFQPYKRGSLGPRNPLWLLQALNNSDKHRVITVVTASAGTVRLVGLSGGTRLKLGVPLRPNAKIGHVRPLPADGAEVLDIRSGKLVLRTQHQTEVSTTITPGVRFGDTCDAVRNMPVIRTLRGMAEEVASVVDSFDGEF